MGRPHCRRDPARIGGTALCKCRQNLQKDEDVVGVVAADDRLAVGLAVAVVARLPDLGR